MYEMLIFWLVLLILCIGIEVLTLGLTTIWFAGGALVAIFANLLYAPIFVQIIVFFLVSLVLLFFTRPIAMKYFNRDRIKTNVESMVGRQAIVTGEIDNVKAMGQVTVNGQEWMARSWDDRVRIPEGAIVTVKAISGVKLIVEAGKQPGMDLYAGQKAAAAGESIGAGAKEVRGNTAETVVQELEKVVETAVKEPEKVAETAVQEPKKIEKTAEQEPEKVAETVVQEPKKIEETAEQEPEKIAETVVQEPKKIEETAEQEPEKVAETAARELEKMEE